MKSSTITLKTKNSTEELNQHYNIDCLFINPMDMLTSVPYVKTLTMIAVLREAGIRVSLTDPSAQNKNIRSIINSIEENQPKIICISAVPSTLPFAYKLIQEIKKLEDQPIIIIEGYHVNADPTIVKELDIEYGLVGDAEYTVLELCQKILSDQPVSESIDGLILHKNGKLIVNRPALVKDLNVLPVPAFELMSIGNYYSASTDKRIMYMFTSRGCPYECNFCANPTQRFYRYLSLDNTIHQLDFLVNELKVEWIEFMDLTFTTNKKRTIELCEAIYANNIQFQWGCETRADLVDDEILSAMKKAGCEKITFGVESGNEKVRFRTGKKISNEQFINAFDLCKKHKIRTMANFILGHPNETEEEMRDSIKFAKVLDPFNVLYIRMTPLPDVDIYTDGVKAGEIDPDIWVQYMKGEISHPTYYPKTISPEKMEYLFKKALLSYYFSFRTIGKYLFLFKNVRFMMKSIGVFLGYTFGGPKFK